jgi:DUF3040 family protein
LHPTIPPETKWMGGVIQGVRAVQGQTCTDRGQAVDGGWPGGPDLDGRQVNARERRLLARIERRLRFDDPELARQLSRGGRASTTEWLLDFALGLSVLLTSLVWFVGAVGWVVMLAAGVVALTVLRLRRRRAQRDS